MEFGPRALGNRSILGDPRVKDMQKKMNLKIKNRESFRPFAPAILEEYKQEFFNLNYESPYMLITKNLAEKFLVDLSTNNSNFKGIEKVNEIRSELPAITHIDNSCRVQTVSKSRNFQFYSLLEQFYKITKCPILINTSFNVRGEPIVCSPEDAFRCFLYTQIDVLILGSFIIEKTNLPDNIQNFFQKPLLIED
jgi:carbamoyltransferase